MDHQLGDFPSSRNMPNILKDLKLPYNARVNAWEVSTTAGSVKIIIEPKIRKLLHYGFTNINVHHS